MPKRLETPLQQPIIMQTLGRDPRTRSRQPIGDSRPVEQVERSG
jgi:hypothetical protein